MGSKTRAQKPRPQVVLKASQKRELREKLRREKTLRRRPPGPKDHFMRGCFVVGAALAVIFIASYTYSCVFVE